MFTWQLPVKEKTKDEIRMLIDRDARLLYIFTGAAHRVFNYENQFVDSVPFLKKYKGQVTVLLDQETDHTGSCQERCRII